MEIRLTRHGQHVAVVTLDNQPRLNAMTRSMMADLGRLWDELERDDSRCIVLTGAGERAFCARGLRPGARESRARERALH